MHYRIRRYKYIWKVILILFAIFSAHTTINGLNSKAKAQQNLEHRIFLIKQEVDNQFDGLWKGEYNITKNYGDFKCQGGDIEVLIDGSRVALEMSNDRSNWFLEGRINNDGSLIAEGKIARFDAKFEAKANEENINGTLDVQGLCGGAWSATRV